MLTPLRNKPAHLELLFERPKPTQPQPNVLGLGECMDLRTVRTAIQYLVVFPRLAALLQPHGLHTNYRIKYFERQGNFLAMK